MSTKLLFVTAAALPLLAIADRPATTTHAQQPTAVSAAAPAISDATRARLDEIRRSLVAQIAVVDAGENSFRAPTPAESAALSAPAGEAVEAQALPGGGLALPATADQLSFSVATIGEDGTVHIGHGAAPAAAQAGGSRAR